MLYLRCVCTGDYSGDQIEKNDRGGTRRTYGGEESAYRILGGKLEEKRTLGRPRRRWEDNIKIDLQEVECDSMDWIDAAQDRDRWRALVNSVMNLRVPFNAGNFLTI